MCNIIEKEKWTAELLSHLEWIIPVTQSPCLAENLPNQLSQISLRVEKENLNITVKTRGKIVISRGGSYTLV